MRTFLLSLMALLLFAAPALALDMANKNFYVQGVFSLPTGEFGDVAGSGFGGGLGVRVPQSDVLSFRAEASYIMFGSKELAYFDYSYGMIPFVVLAEYSFSQDKLFYGLGGLGLFMSRWSLDYTGPGDAPYLFEDSESTTDFGISVGGGYAVNDNIAIEGRFNIISGANQVTIHGLYHF